MDQTLPTSTATLSRISAALLLLACACALSACPKKVSAPASTEHTPQGGPPQHSAPPQLPDGVSGQAPPPSAGGDPAAPLGGSDRSLPDDQSVLAGRWFALFGREHGGIGLYSYEEGKFLDFGAGGALTFSTAPAHGATSQVTGRYWLADGQLHLQLPGGSAQVLGRAAPPSGLILAQRGEIGTENGTPDSLGLKLTADHDFLGLSDGAGRLVVYGRDANANVQGVQLDPAAKWTLLLGLRRQDALVDLQPGLLQVKYGPPGQMKLFNGRLVHGYWVGELKTDAGTAFGAMTATSPELLNGLFVQPPYTEIFLLFDLQKVK